MLGKRNWKLGDDDIHMAFATSQLCCAATFFLLIMSLVCINNEEEKYLFSVWQMIIS